MDPKAKNMKSKVEWTPGLDIESAAFENMVDEYYEMGCDWECPSCGRKYPEFDCTFLQCEPPAREEDYGRPERRW